jgi:hypothetical protein
MGKTIKIVLPQRGQAATKQVLKNKLSPTDEKRPMDKSRR